MHQLMVLHPMTRSSGHTAVEYGMIGTIMVVGSIAIFLVLGTNLDKVFSSLQGQSRSHMHNAISANATQSSQAHSWRGGQNTTGNALLNGASNASVLEVSAANGEFKALSAKAHDITFQTPPEQLSPTDVKALERNMSNSTFQMGKLEEQVQNLLKFSNNDPSQFMNTNLTFNGQTQPAITLAIGLQDQAQTLVQMQDYLNATHASDAEKAQMKAKVDQVSALAAAIYSQTQTIQNENQKAIAQAAADKAAQASATLASTHDGSTLLNAITTSVTATVAQQVANATTATATSAATAAATAGAPVNTSAAVAVTDTAAGTMCSTGVGHAANRQCTHAGMF
jgi:Flp pilus assembly pilin Flp